MNGLKIKLGVKEDGTEASVPLNDFCHAMIVGQTGSGKSTAIKEMAESFISLGSSNRVYVFDGKCGGDYKDLPNFVNFKSVKAMITEVLAELRSRQKDARDLFFSKSTISHLDYLQSLPKILVVIDEASTIDDGDLLSLHSERDIEGSFGHAIYRILLEARSFGIHMVLSSQRLTYQRDGATRDLYPIPIRANLSTKLIFRGDADVAAKLGVPQINLSKGEFLLKVDGYDGETKVRTKKS